MFVHWLVDWLVGRMKARFSPEHLAILKHHVKLSSNYSTQNNFLPGHLHNHHCHSLYDTLHADLLA
jgi:hypothetical protein